MLFLRNNLLIRKSKPGLAARLTPSPPEASYPDRHAVQSVQVVVDASKHAPAGVDVHVRMVLEADGQLRACNVQHIVETPSPSPSSSTSSSPSPPERHALPPQPLNACHVRMEAARRLHPQPALPAVKPEDLVPYDVIGAGGQGSVMAVLHKPTQQLFAMKIIPKDIHNRRMLELVFREQAASLELVGCHFFAQLRASWEDNANFYLLFDYCSGGDLAKKIDRSPNGRLEMSQAKKYFGTIVLGLEYLHARGIIHRDLKPQNVLVTGDGHPKIIDLGLVSTEGRTAEQHPWMHLVEWVLGPGLRSMREYMREHTTDKANNIGTSRCGTVGYIPTEVFRGEPHTIRSDVFSLGVTFYEMIHGKLPYGITHRHRDMKVVYDLMMTQPLVFGEHVDLLMRDLLTKMLALDPSERPTMEQIKCHAALADLNWEELASPPLPRETYPSAAYQPSEEAKQVKFGVPFPEGKAPHFWFQYTSPSLHPKTEVSEKKPLLKKTAEQPKATPTPQPTPRPVPMELAATFAHVPRPLQPPFAPRTNSPDGASSVRTASATLCSSLRSAGSSATAVSRPSPAPSPSGSQPRPSPTHPTPKRAASYTAQQLHSTISSTIQDSAVASVRSPGGRTLVDPDGAWSTSATVGGDSMSYSSITLSRPLGRIRAVVTVSERTDREQPATMGIQDLLDRAWRAFKGVPTAQRRPGMRRLNLLE